MPNYPPPCSLACQRIKSRLAKFRWALTGLSLSLLVAFALPGAQIRLGAAQLAGLIGTYTSDGSWQALPCEADGTLIPHPAYDQDGMLLLTGKEHGTASDTYPTPMKDAALKDPVRSPYLGHTGVFGPNKGDAAAQFLYDTSTPPMEVPANFGSGDAICLPSYEGKSYAFNNYGNTGLYSVPDPQDATKTLTGDIKGGVITDIVGTLNARFKWFYVDHYNHPVTLPADDSGPPDQMYLLLHTAVSATSEVGYGKATTLTGLTATASADDGMGDAVGTSTPAVTAAIPGASVTQTLDTPFLLSPALGSNGVAEVPLTGHITANAVNGLAYGEWRTYPGSSSPYYVTTNGPTSAIVTAFVKGRTAAVYPIVAHSTADTAGWDGRKPRFFSGTNCMATGALTVPAPMTISRAQILIGGYVVREYHDTTKTNLSTDAGTLVTTGTNQKSVMLRVFFDSTHFADGTSLAITFNVWDGTGKMLAPATLSACAYNKGYVLTNHANVGFWLFGGFADHRNCLSKELTMMNHSVMASSWHRASAISSHIPENTVFYISTHAASTVFGDCYDGDGAGAGLDYLKKMAGANGLSVESAVAAKSLNQPPYNFASVDGCHSAGMMNPQTGSVIAGGAATGFGIYGRDRAFLGWSNFMDGSVDYGWTEGVWGYLKAGDTLFDACVESTSDRGAPIGSPDTGIDWDPRNQEYIAPLIVGDPLMKLHGVYLGADDNQWFRS